MQTQFKTAEEWEKYESQIAGDPQNLALCVAHKDAAKGDDKEFMNRLLALRAASRISGTMEPSQLKERQRLRFTFYTNWLDNRRAKLQKLRANPNYKTPRQRKDERERLIYIRWCLRTGKPVTWPIISMVWDKSRGYAVAVREDLNPEFSKASAE